MLPSRGVVRSVSAASRTQFASQLGATRGYATARIGNGKHIRTTTRLPIGSAHRATPLRNIAIAGPVVFGQIPSTNRTLSLWGSSSKKPEPVAAPPAQPAPVESAPTTIQSQATPDVAATAETANAANSSGGWSLWGWGSSSKPPAPAQVETVAQPAATEPVLSTAPLEQAAVVPPASGSAGGADPAAELSNILSSELDKYDSISSIPEQIGYLHTLGIDFGVGTTSMIQWVLEHVHVYSGLPWWGSILATSLLIRVCLWKPVMMGQEHSTRLNLLRQNEPGYNRAMEAWKDSMVNKDVVGGQAAKAAMKALEERHKVNKLMPFIGFVQIPIGFGMFRILRAMSDLPVPALETGGFGWISNLTVPDPWYILPFIGPLTMVATMRITNKHSNAQQQSAMKAISYVFVPLGFFVTCFMPAGLQWYFVTASVPGLLQTWLTFQPWFRRWVGLTPLPEPLAKAPAGSISPTSTGSAPGIFENMKKSLKDATEMATAKREDSKQRKAKETNEAEEAKLQAEYYESLRERMAELEKQMKRRP
ncbi:hypothetical protein jhhlp_005819 [Lomentospora prolificans]|uniref:Membrane insertase YidC/Oxa/ALB C-terminal domain-containing protein n=1 Tax=Lomentospora prolificans TaxID=41688 RepID=A0A2N3N460_9PEZI|nr:hypothetical protein jhhlp_005819 [Lomentospora prolificans]